VEHEPRPAQTLFSLVPLTDLTTLFCESVKDVMPSAEIDIKPPPVVMVESIWYVSGDCDPNWYLKVILMRLVLSWQAVPVDIEKVTVTPDSSVMLRKAACTCAAVAE